MGPEISDLIVRHDPVSLARIPVRRDDVVDTLLAHHNAEAAALVQAMPATDGVLDAAAVDGLLIRAHSELQRLHEEFQHGRRVVRLLRPLIAAIREVHPGAPVRVVDVGGGLGYVVRWLAASGALGPDVDLVGCDFNTALIAGAQALAAEEQLPCRFVVGNAFAMATPATIHLSTGVVHHFRNDALVDFFAAQAGPENRAFVHYDITPTWAAPVGAWLFHKARMRQPLARHDGILSARRAHSNTTLVQAAKSAAPGMAIGLFEPPHPLLPMLRVLRPVVGVQPALVGPLKAALGPLSRGLVGFP